MYVFAVGYKQLCLTLIYFALIIYESSHSQHYVQQNEIKQYKNAKFKNVKKI